MNYLESDQEQWENASEGTVFVNKLAMDGTSNEVAHVIRSGKRILISPKERKLLNQDRCYAVSIDPFLNGTLIPIQLAETSTDITENPNYMSGGELEDLFKVRNHMKFKSELKKIDAASLLHKLSVLADDEDMNATVGQVRAIGERLEAVQETFSGKVFSNEFGDRDIENLPPSIDR